MNFFGLNTAVTGKSGIHLFAFSALFASACTVGGHDSPDAGLPDKPGVVPGETVLDAFELRFPHAENTVWSLADSYYVADFTAHGSSVNAWFNTAGDWRLIKASVHPSSLPEHIFAVFSSGAFAGWDINHTSVLARKGMDNLYVINVSGGAGDVSLYYSGYGDLVKAVGNARIHVDRPLEIPLEIRTLAGELFSDPEIIDLWSDAIGVRICVMDADTYKVAALDSDHEWICTIANLNAVAVPDRVMAGFQDSEYSRYSVDQVKRMINREGIFYLFYFRNGQKNMVATFSESGGLKNLLTY